jgi:hypothetical protein
MILIVIEYKKKEKMDEEDFRSSVGIEYCIGVFNG